MADPVSGRLVADGLHAQLDTPDIVEYPTIEHLPHVEIPDIIATQLTA
jgi:hypothetical protein